VPDPGAPHRLLRRLVPLLALLLLLPFAVPFRGGAATPAPSPIPTASSASSAPTDPCASPTVSASTTPTGSPNPAADATVQPCLIAQASASLDSPPSSSPAPAIVRPVLTPIPVVPPIPAPAATAAPTPAATPRPKPGRVVKKLDVPISRRLPCYEFPRQGCVNLVDIYHPTNKGRWPTVVTIHGRPRTPTDMAELAKALAAKGAVVFNADYRGVRPVSKGFPESIHDVACAIRYARANTARYGGDPDHIVLVGHSYGGYVGMMVSVAGDRMPGKGIGCLEDRGSSLPDGFVHVAGVSITKASEPLDVIYFGGPQSAIPEVWRRGNVFHQIDVGGNRDLKVGIIFELDDPFLGYGHATWLRDALRRNDYDVRMQLLEEGSTHFDVLDMDTALGRRILDFTQRIINRTRPAEPAG
jgi:pimeloyl-ACP methyl ester carboxylesterase